MTATVAFSHVGIHVRDLAKMETPCMPEYDTGAEQ
jgi:hypothetical protein